MKLHSVRIQRLRSCNDVTVHFHPYTCLVGPNGAGKSTILCALNIFFRDTYSGGGDLLRLSREDFHKKDTSRPITITLTFTDLSLEAQTDFADYYRDGKLIIAAEATFCEETQRAEVRQFGERTAMAEFSQFFAAANDGTKVAALRTIFAQIKENEPELTNATTKEAMIESLRSFELSRPERCQPLRSADEFYGFSKGINRLAKHIQWVYVPAVKDASTEQTDARNTALSRLLGRTLNARAKLTDQISEIRQKAQTAYVDLLSSNQATLEGLTASLQGRLTDWAHPNATVRLEWWQDPEKAISVQEPSAQIVAGEAGFEGELCRLGHGLQRSYLLALLHELSSTNDSSGPRLLLGCEEPELYQHPPQARHLFSVFETLTANSAQVIVSTHSPAFVSGQMFEDVRLVQKEPDANESRVTFVSFNEIAQQISEATSRPVIRSQGMRAKLHQTLQANLNEMFFAQRVILVEGQEDIAYITSYLHLTDRWSEFRRLGCHMIAADGKDKIISPLVIANSLRIRTLVVFDSDGHKYGPLANSTPAQVKKSTQSQANKIASDRPLHVRDNTAILTLCGVSDPEPFPQDTFFSSRVIMWHSDIGKIVEDDFTAAHWRRCREKAFLELGQPGGLEKNSMQIAIAMEKAYLDGKRSPHLEELCLRILAMADPVPAAMAAGRSW